ncbi:MAG: hypothetical protein ABL901_12660 [Hyphomicrobiaceae bacterium]
MIALQKARAAWGTSIPDWVCTLADACSKRSLRSVAAQLDLSPSMVSQVLSNRWLHPSDKIEAKVRTVLGVSRQQEAVVGWGNAMPDWVVALAAACDQAPQTEVARRIEYSPAVVSQVLRNTYKGNLKRVEFQVRGLLMEQTLKCPCHWDDMGFHACVWNQEIQFDKKRALPGVGAIFRATCPTCPNWLKPKKEKS